MGSIKSKGTFNADKTQDDEDEQVEPKSIYEPRHALIKMQSSIPVHSKKIDSHNTSYSNMKEMISRSIQDSKQHLEQLQQIKSNYTKKGIDK